MGSVRVMSATPTGNHTEGMQVMSTSLVDAPVTEVIDYQQVTLAGTTMIVSLLVVIDGHTKRMPVVGVRTDGTLHTNTDLAVCEPDCRGCAS
jgi:hypothetical protein